MLDKIVIGQPDEQVEDVIEHSCNCPKINKEVSEQIRDNVDLRRHDRQGHVLEDIGDKEHELGKPMNNGKNNFVATVMGQKQRK